jgi:hypothetical protein
MLNAMIPVGFIVGAMIGVIILLILRKIMPWIQHKIISKTATLYSLPPEKFKKFKWVIKFVSLFIDFKNRFNKQSISQHSDIDRIINVKNIKKFMNSNFKHNCNYKIIQAPAGIVDGIEYACVSESFKNKTEMASKIMMFYPKLVYIYKINKKKYIIDEEYLSEDDILNKKFIIDEAYNIKYFIWEGN